MALWERATLGLIVYMAGCGPLETRPIDHNLAPVDPDSIERTVYETMIEQLSLHYGPVASEHGKALNLHSNWAEEGTPSARIRPGKPWDILLPGAFFRHPLMSDEGAMLVMCHEIGHAFAGYPFKGSYGSSVEGNADYFATQACAKAMWRNQTSENERFRHEVSSVARSKCDAIWQDWHDQNLCYRIAAGSLNLAHIVSERHALPEAQWPTFDQHDDSRVTQTRIGYGSEQCRLDTLMAGALCTVLSDPSVIPGLENGLGHNSRTAQNQAFAISCQSGLGARPSCWFKAL